jgi:hypothetical protein
MLSADVQRTKQAVIKDIAPEPEASVGPTTTTIGIDRYHPS